MNFRTTVALLLITVSTVPALAQNRFMDQAREAAERRAENAAIRAAENPPPVKKAPPAAEATAEAAPAAPAAEAAPAAPAAEAAPAKPAQ